MTDSQNSKTYDADSFFLKSTIPPIDFLEINQQKLSFEKERNQRVQIVTKGSIGN